MSRFSFIGPSYTSESLNADCQRCVNFYPEFIESQKGKNVQALYPTPGLSVFSALGGPSVRGLAVVSVTGVGLSRVFAVSGTVLYELFDDGTSLARGTVAADAFPASIAVSETQLLIISAGTAYSYELSTNTLAPVVGMLGTPWIAGFVDGYFIVLLKLSKQFQISALLDATSWNGLDTAIVSVFPDTIESMICDHREIWFLGRRASVAYYNSGNPDFPFDLIPGAFIEEGSSSTFAPVKMDNSIFWLGGSVRGGRVAWRAQGYTPQRVSNHAVENTWDSYSDVSDSVGYSYEESGHTFWVIYFPSANATWVYDASTNMWHERGFWNPGRAAYDAHRSQCHVYFNGRHLVGDWNSGNVYEMKITFQDDFGNPLRRLRRAPHLSNELKWTYFHRFQLDMEVGLGLNSGLGSNPQVVLRWSNDGAKTWSNDHAASGGRIGEYRKRVVWRRLGRARDRVFEISMTDPIPWRLIDAYLEASPGDGS